VHISSPSDISEALSLGMASNGLLLEEGDLSPSFYDLRSGLAGELFQKFVNYQVPLVLVVSDLSAHGQRFRELANVHRTHPMVRILSDRVEALRWLTVMRSAS